MIISDVLIYFFLCLFFVFFFFFFSSRRRHTRSYGDWSSDVCSSDLGNGVKFTGCSSGPWECRTRPRIARSGTPRKENAARPSEGSDICRSPSRPAEIGRASCRERVEVREGEGAG